MSKVTIAGDVNGTGVFTIASPNSNTNRTITLPDATGTLLSTATPGVPIGGPAFSAFKTSNQAVTANVSTKVIFEAESFDTNSNFASSTFTPTVAGYYQVNAFLECLGFAGSYLVCQIKKNGSGWAVGSNFPTSASAGPVTSASALVFLNGSTDFVEVYAQASNNFTILSGSESNAPKFSGVLVRSAT